MRINVYAEELTDRIEVVTKEVEGRTFYGIRLYLYLPVTRVYAVSADDSKKERRENIAGPFIHREGDDDSAAITFWVPWKLDVGSNFGFLHSIFRDLATAVITAEGQEDVRKLSATRKENS